MSPRVRTILICSVVIVAGVFALIFPDAMADVDATGRRAWLKGLIAMVWGRAAGVVAIPGAGACLAMQLKSGKGEAVRTPEKQETT